MLVPLASATGIFKGVGVGVTNAVYHAGSTMMTNQHWPPRACRKGGGWVPPDRPLAEPGLRAGLQRRAHHERAASSATLLMGLQGGKDQKARLPEPTSCCDFASELQLWRQTPRPRAGPRAAW